MTPIARITQITAQAAPVPKSVQGTGFAAALAAKNQAMATDTLKRMTQRMLLNEIVALGNIGHKKSQTRSHLVDIAQMFWSHDSDQSLLDTLRSK